MVEQRLKVIIVGEPGVGKKNVAKGADVCMPFKSLGVSIGKKINLDRRINFKLTLLFWTLTKGRPKVSTYFNGSGAAIIVGDLNSLKSIKKMRFWADSVKENIGNIPMFFIGTKNNSNSNKNLSKLSKLADDYNSHYFILYRDSENGFKPILKSIAKHLANHYCKLLQNC